MHILINTIEEKVYIPKDKIILRKNTKDNICSILVTGNNCILYITKEEFSRLVKILYE